MTPFKARVLKRHSEIDSKDFDYFTQEAENKIKAMDLPEPNCEINGIFIGSNDELYNRREYCLKNCGLKCVDEARGLNVEWTEEELTTEGRNA